MKRGQSRLQSAVETVTSVALGFLLSLGLQVLLMRLYGITTDISRDAQIVLCFTVLSLLRTYFLRRFFNRFTNS